MKIGFDAKRAYHNYTGLGNYSRDLIKSLLQKNSQDEFFMYSPKSAKNPRFSFIEGKENIHKRFPETPIHKTFKGFWRSINLEKFLLKDGIEIFHGLSNEIPRRRKFGAERIKYVVTIHDLIFRRFPRNYRAIDRRIHNIKFKYASRNADVVIAISEQTKRDIVQYYKVPAEKIKVIYQTCHENFKKEYSEEIKQHIKTNFNLPDEFILNVGTIETRKNLNALLQAIPLMKNDLPIVVVGRKTKYFNFLKVQMQKLKIDEDRFIFLKDVTMDQLPAIYQLSTIFVYPSVFEGFGIPIIEALNSGVPVITTKGGCFPEAGGPDSVYVDTNNFAELGKTIDDLLENPAQQKLMTEKGLAYVKKFDSEELTNQLLEVYSDLT